MSEFFFGLSCGLVCGVYLGLVIAVTCKEWSKP